MINENFKIIMKFVKNHLILNSELKLPLCLSYEVLIKTNLGFSPKIYLNLSFLRVYPEGRLLNYTFLT